jgi:hypothetical protein
METAFLLIIFIIIFIFFFVLIRLLWQITIISSAILSLIISLIIVSLIDQIIPCDRSDNRYSAHSFFILGAIALILVIIYVFYMAWRDIDPCLIRSTNAVVVST